jgi:hypothetical protein
MTGVAYTVPLSMKSSTRSFRWWSRRWCIRYVTSAGFMFTFRLSVGDFWATFGEALSVELSVGTRAGMAKLRTSGWAGLDENRDSRPPLNWTLREIEVIGLWFIYTAVVVASLAKALECDVTGTVRLTNLTLLDGDNELPAI